MDAHSSMSSLPSEHYVCRYSFIFTLFFLQPLFSAVSSCSPKSIRENWCTSWTVYCAISHSRLNWECSEKKDIFANWNCWASMNSSTSSSPRVYRLLFFTFFFIVSCVLWHDVLLFAQDHHPNWLEDQVISHKPFTEYLLDCSRSSFGAEAKKQAEKWKIWWKTTEISDFALFRAVT